MLGCANPEGATGGNIARQARHPRRPAGHGGGADRQPLLLVGPAGDRPRRAAASRQDGVPVAVAGGLESISLVQMNMNTKFYRNELDRRAQGRALHADDRDRRHRRQALRHQPRGAGRIRADQPAAHRRRRRRPAGSTPRSCRMTAIMAVENKETKEITKDRHAASDEGNRPDTTLEGLAKLKPVRGDDQFITAGNASQLSDGASACVLMSDKEAAKRRASSRSASFRGFAVAGCEPDEMGIGPVFADPAAAAAHRPQDGRHRPVGAQRGVRRAGALLPRQARHPAGRSSTSTAARSPSATPTA